MPSTSPSWRPVASLGPGRRPPALPRGADAVRIGTLCATREADIHPDYVQALVAARGEDTVLTETFSTLWPDAPHRVLGSCVTAVASAGHEIVGQARLGDMTMPIPRLAPMAPTTAMTGDIQAMAMYAGQGVGALSTVQPAAEVVRRLAHDAATLLTRSATQVSEERSASCR